MQTVTTQPSRTKPRKRFSQICDEKPGRKTGLFVCWLPLARPAATNAGPHGDGATFQPDSANGRMRNGVGSITDLNVLSTQLLQPKKASTDVYSTALAGGGLTGVGDRLSPP